MKIHPWEVPTGSDWVSTKASIYLSPWGRSCREEDQKHVRGIAKFQEAAADYTAWSWKQEERREGKIKSHDGAGKTEGMTHLRCPNTLRAFREEVRPLRAATRASDLASGPSSASQTHLRPQTHTLDPFFPVILNSSYPSALDLPLLRCLLIPPWGMAALLTGNPYSPSSHPSQLLPLFHLCSGYSSVPLPA